MKPFALWTAALAGLILVSCSQKPVIEITLSPEIIDQAQEGRLVLMFSLNQDQEPRFQIQGGPNTQIAFGIDVSHWTPGTPLVFDLESFG